MTALTLAAIAASAMMMPEPEIELYPEPVTVEEAVYIVDLGWSQCRDVPACCGNELENDKLPSGTWALLGMPMETAYAFRAPGALVRFGGGATRAAAIPAAFAWTGSPAGNSSGGDVVLHVHSRWCEHGCLLCRTVDRDDEPPIVPLPASLWMLLLGVCGLGAAKLSNLTS